MSVNKNVMIRALTYCAITGGLFLSSSASALFVVDYQGLDKEKARHAIARSKIAPEGYNVLTDKTRDIVHEFGRGNPSKITSFGDDMSLSDGISMIMPDGWVAFVDEDLSVPKTISWDAQNYAWTQTLRDVGINAGLRFIVDWDQRVVQIFGERGFKEPDITDAVEVVDPKTGKTLLIYPDGSGKTAGKLMHKDKTYPIRIVE